MQPIIEATSVIYGIAPADVPVPSVNGGDALEAVRALLDFEIWLLQNSTLEEWAGIIAVDGSPAHDAYLGGFETLGGSTALFDGGADPFSIIEIRFATPEEIAEIPSGLVDSSGSGAAVVVFRTSIAPHVVSDPEEPTLDKVREGWVDLAEIAIVAPSPVGWAWYWQGRPR